jgi:ethanolamine ammonia-lyase large subunit
MLHYQTTSFHDAAYARSLLGLRPAPEFERWLIDVGIFDSEGGLSARALAGESRRLLDHATSLLP